MGRLFEECPVCDGGRKEPPARLAGGNCPGCGGRRYVATGLTGGQADRAVRERAAYLAAACTFYDLLSYHSYTDANLARRVADWRSRYQDCPPAETLARVRAAAGLGEKGETGR
jgi:hypothetical protein